MKFRTGFVSNSSSSSFVCDFCGEDVSGWDMCLSDAEMFNCEGCGHTVCDDHRLDVSVEQLKQWFVLATAEDKKHYWTGDAAEVAAFDGTSADELLELMIPDEQRHYTPSCMCPLCQLTKVTIKDMLRYLLAVLDRKSEDVVAEIQAKFTTLAEMNVYIEKQTEEKTDEI